MIFKFLTVKLIKIILTLMTINIFCTHLDITSKTLELMYIFFPKNYNIFTAILLIFLSIIFIDSESYNKRKLVKYFFLLFIISFEILLVNHFNIDFITNRKFLLFNYKEVLIILNIIIISILFSRLSFLIFFKEKFTYKTINNYNNNSFNFVNFVKLNAIGYILNLYLFLLSYEYAKFNLDNYLIILNNIDFYAIQIISASIIQNIPLFIYLITKKRRDTIYIFLANIFILNLTFYLYTSSKINKIDQFTLQLLALIFEYLVIPILLFIILKIFLKIKKIN